jgi:hypothetical protein
VLQYLAITKDRYELPIASADTVGELASILHLTPNAVSSAIARPGSRANKRRTFNIIVVQIENYIDELGDIPVPKESKIAEIIRMRGNK